MPWNEPWRPRCSETAAAFLLGVVASLILLIVAAVAFVDVDPDWSAGWESDDDPAPLGA